MHKKFDHLRHTLSYLLFIFETHFLQCVSFFKIRLKKQVNHDKTLSLQIKNQNCLKCPDSPLPRSCRGPTQIDGTARGPPLRRAEGVLSPRHHGSWSIKNVLPTMAPHLNYGSLGDVQDGSAAGTAYLQIIESETYPAERQRLVSELLAYCEHDTLALVELVKYLSK